tara:strand:- start:84 stop:353 length:270 start_codon:yes stop_codon:yes gene_type:complete
MENIMKIILKDDLVTRNAETGQKEVLKKGVLEIDEKRGMWLCQVYSLTCSVASAEAVPTPKVLKPKKVSGKPKQKPKAIKVKPNKKLSK